MHGNIIKRPDDRVDKQLMNWSTFLSIIPVYPGSPTYIRIMTNNLPPYSLDYIFSTSYTLFILIKQIIVFFKIQKQSKELCKDYDMKFKYLTRMEFYGVKLV